MNKSIWCRLPGARLAFLDTKLWFASELELLGVPASFSDAVPPALTPIGPPLLPGLDFSCSLHASTLIRQPAWFATEYSAKTEAKMTVKAIRAVSKGQVSIRLSDCIGKLMANPFLYLEWPRRFCPAMQEG